MKKFIPVLIAIALICVVAFVNFGSKIQEKYSYGTEWADYSEYFKTSSSDDVPVILQDEKIGEYGKYINGHVYFDKAFIEKYLTVRFYYDSNENLLLYTNGTETIRSEVGGKIYTQSGTDVSVDYLISTVRDDDLYIAVDYIKKFVNFSCDFFENPYRVQMYTEWGDKQVAGVKKDAQVRWRGGVKSEILTDVYAGEVVEILEVMDDWTKVKTDNAFIGYLPNNVLEDTLVIKENPVTIVPEEEYSSLNRNKKINLIWHNIEYQQGGTELVYACANIKEVNVISPTWYWLSDEEGNIESVATNDFVESAHKMGMEVWALVANFHTGTDVDLHEVLSYTSKRAVLIDNLIAETVLRGADGINVDFENVSSKTSDDYIQFIRELSLACHKAGLVISVDNYVPSEYTAHYNRKEQGLFADYVIIMGYDEHYVGSDAGSVSSMQWMSDGIKNTIAVVPKEKVINAIPFYTRVWITSNGKTTSEAVDMTVANDFIKRHNITTTWDDVTSQNYGESLEGGTYYQVWLEDADSIRVRLNVMDTYEIAGVAAWKLGQETKDIWDIIEAYMKN